MFRRLARTWLAIVAATLLVLPNAAHAERWVGTWAASQQIPEPRNALPSEQLTDATLRQVVRISAGGPRIRLRRSLRRASLLTLGANGAKAGANDKGHRI